MPVQCTCLQCEAPFLARPSKIAQGNGRYCSRACFAVARMIPEADQFWAKIKRTDSCWEWIGRSSRAGYGRVNGSGNGARDPFAHRFALEMAMGAPLPDGLFALHTCDNPPCVRNDDPGIYVVRGIARPRFGHLWMGTQQDNLADMVDKGRHSHGETHKSRTRPESVKRGEASNLAMLSPEAVRQIRARHAAGGISQQALADLFGVHRRTVGHIVNRERWAHI